MTVMIVLSHPRCLTPVSGTQIPDLADCRFRSVQFISFSVSPARQRKRGAPAGASSLIEFFPLMLTEQIRIRSVC